MGIKQLKSFTFNYELEVDNTAISNVFAFQVLSDKLNADLELFIQLTKGEKENLQVKLGSIFLSSPSDTCILIPYNIRV